MFKKIYSCEDFDLLFVRFDQAALRELRQLHSEFDCFLINRDADFAGADSPLIDTLAVRTFDWIEVFGFNSEEIHDQIDQASVRGGRQHKAGDGSPMTSWHDDMGATELVDHLLMGGQSSCDTRIIILIGSQADEATLLQSLQRGRSSNE